MQTVIIEGYLTANPSVLSAQGSGKKRASFRVLETTRFRKADGTPGERTTGFNCICFNEATAEKYIGPFARKGSRVVIQGHVENDTWTGKGGVEHYDMRVPEPRTGAEPETAEPGVPPPPPAPARYSAGYAPSRTNRATGPSPGEQAARSGLFFEGASTGAGPAAHAGAGPATAGARADAADVGATYNGHTLTAPLSPYELKAGAIIPAVLLTGVDTARAGPVVATVSQNVYDTVSGRHLVLPQGTRLIGRHEGESAYGDRRAFLTWDRLILPNGKSLVLTGEPGVDAQGAVGVRGQVDRRLFPLLVGTLFAGAITTLGQIARDGDGEGSGGLLGDAGDAAAIEGSQVGGRLVDRELDVRPSIRLRAGAPVRVMITRDLILEPYQP